MIHHRTTTIRLSFLLIALAIATGATKVASAQTEDILYSFTGSNDGAVPFGNLVEDSAGNLYGVNVFGGGFCGYLPL